MIWYKTLLNNANWIYLAKGKAIDHQDFSYWYMIYVRESQRYCCQDEVVVAAAQGGGGGGGSDKVNYC